MADPRAALCGALLTDPSRPQGIIAEVKRNLARLDARYAYDDHAERSSPEA